MGVGAMLLKLRQKYGHGLRTAWYRDHVRPSILNTPPVVGTIDKSCEIHVLTWREDWLNVIWMLKTFYYYSSRKYSLCIHEDGTLSDSEASILEHHFPNARVIRRRDADSEMQKLLLKYPLSRKYRDANPLALKVFDFSAFLDSERMLLLDSDILFFSEPTELLRRIDNETYTKNTLNKDWAYGYSINIDEARQHVPFEICDRINSGLGLVHRPSINFEMVEQYMALPNILSHHHRIEQTLIALCSSRFGFQFLPVEYDVHLGPFVAAHPCRHFTGPIRHRMYSEGIRHLMQQGFIASQAC